MSFLNIILFLLIAFAAFILILAIFTMLILYKTSSLKKDYYKTFALSFIFVFLVLMWATIQWGHALNTLNAMKKSQTEVLK